MATGTKKILGVRALAEIGERKTRYVLELLEPNGAVRDRVDLTPLVEKAPKQEGK